MVENAELSQEELDILLGKAGMPGPGLTDKEDGALKEAYSDSVKTMATSLAAILNEKVTLTPPQVATLSPDEIKTELPSQAIVVDFNYEGDIGGPTYIIFGKDQGALIADLMMGGGGSAPPQELNELYLSALGEALAPMITSSTKILSSNIGKTLQASEPKIKVVNFPGGMKELSIMRENKVVEMKSAFKLGKSEGIFLQILPLNLAKPLVDQMEDAGYTPSVKASSLTGIHPVQFGTLKSAPIAGLPSNIELIENVPLGVTVELGRTKMIVKDILQLVSGKIIELDKLADEPVDILANGCLIAKGVVVVVDENFGVRITDICTPLQK